MTVEELMVKKAQCQGVIADAMKQAVEQFEEETGVMVRGVEIDGPYRKTTSLEYSTKARLQLCL